MGTNAWSTLGSGLMRIGDKAIDFAQLYNAETDRRLRRQREDEELARLQKERDAKAAKEAAAEAANKAYSDDVAAAYNPVTKTREVPATSPIEGYPYQNFDTQTEPGQLTLDENIRLGAKHNVLNSDVFKNVNSGLSTQSRVDNQNATLEQRKALFEFNKAKYGEEMALKLDELAYKKEMGNKNYDLNVKKYEHDVEDDKTKNAIAQQHANAHTTSANAAAAKAGAPPKNDGEKQKAKEMPFLEAAKSIDGTPTGNQAALNRLYTAYLAKTPQQQLNILQSVVSDSFLESQRKQGQGFLTALQNKFVNGDREVLNMYYNNIDETKLQNLILSNIKHQDLLDEYKQHLIAKARAKAGK